MTTTEAASSIRTALKTQHGWNSRQVSVKTDYYSMGSAIRITVKDPAILLKDVETVATQFERIHRDEYTGEILSGGNRYVDVRYTHDAITARAAQYIPAVEAAKAAREAAGDNSLIEIAGTRYLLGVNQHGRLTLWSDTHLCESYSVEGIARELACRIR